VARFDPVTWKARASARFRRDLDAGQAGAAARFTLETACIDDLQRVVAWCEARKLEVVFDGRAGGLHDSERRKIRITGRARPDKQLYLLLHECGHHLIGDPQSNTRFSQGYSAGDNDPSIKRSATYRIDVIAEELEAWHRGGRLAKRLELKLDKRAFDKERTTCMKTYMKWCLRLDGYYLEGAEDADEGT
jgi:hypothetical protein